MTTLEIGKDTTITEVMTGCSGCAQEGACKSQGDIKINPVPVATRQSAPLMVTPEQKAAIRNPNYVDEPNQFTVAQRALSANVINAMPVANSNPPMWRVGDADEGVNIHRDPDVGFRVNQHLFSTFGDALDAARTRVVELRAGKKIEAGVDRMHEERVSRSSDLSPHSKATTENPKDLEGVKKPPLELVPDTAIILQAMAFGDGARKYGAYNWREKDVKASIYVAAARRHLAAWYNGEEIAEDSGVHHLGHALACLSILVDAQVGDNLVDDRPTPLDIGALVESLTKKDD